MGMMSFNGITTTSLGIEVQTRPNYILPERDYEIIHVPGKNGDVVIDKNSYKNVPRTYILSCGSLTGDYEEMASTISNWLSSASGYARLEDSYEPEYYREALYSNSTTIYNVYDRGCKVEVEFNCKPERWLKSGDSGAEYTSSSGVSISASITNPTSHESSPLITIWASGSSSTVTIGENIISITNIEESISIDSQLQEIYKGTTNQNGKVRFSKGKFPSLLPGTNSIHCSSDVTKIRIVPRWWTI